MGVPELEKFRAKYPGYNDMPDADLAEKLASKFPDAYGDLPAKVAGYQGPKSLLSGAGRDVVNTPEGDMPPTLKPARPVQAFGQRAADVVTLGYAPHLQAIASKAIYPVMNAATGQDIPADYVKERDAAIKRQTDLAEENPRATRAGTVAGVGASLLPYGRVLGGIARVVRGGQYALPAAQAAEKVPLLVRTAKAAATGAAYGAAANPGDVEGQTSGPQIADRAQNAGVGLAIGGAAEPIIAGAANVLGKIADSGWWKSISNRRAFKAAGPYQRDVLKLNDQQLESIGQTMRDHGLLSDTLPTYESIGAKAAQAADDVGTKLDQQVDYLADQGRKLVPDPTIKPPEYTTLVPVQAGPGVRYHEIRINGDDIAQSVRSELVKPKNIVGKAGDNKVVEQLLHEFETNNASLGIRDAEDLKRAYGKEINWDALPGTEEARNMRERVYRELYTKLKQAVENASEYVADDLGTEAGAQFRKLKSDYGNLDRVAAIAGKRSSREFANRIASPSDYAAALGLFAESGNPLVAAAAGTANHIARKSGNALMSKAAGAGERAAAKMEPVSDAARKLTTPILTPSNTGMISAGLGKKDQYYVDAQGRPVYGLGRLNAIAQ